MRGGTGNVWDYWCCMHPEANNSSPLSDDPKVRKKQIELLERMVEHGRSIGKSLFAKQPDWCPLMREPANAEAQRRAPEAGVAGKENAK